MIKGVFLKSIILGTIIGTTVGLWSQSVQASDSLWLLCDNGKLAVNLLEHRNGVVGAVQKTALSITLLNGNYVFTGELDTTNQNAKKPRRVLLSSIVKDDRSRFIGNISIDYLEPKMILFLNGNLRLGGAPDLNLKINSQLQCKEMRS
jgi:hypothetical protein